MTDLTLSGASIAIMLEPNPHPDPPPISHNLIQRKYIACCFSRFLKINFKREKLDSRVMNFTIHLGSEEIDIITAYLPVKCANEDYLVFVSEIMDRFKARNQTILFLDANCPLDGNFETVHKKTYERKYLALMEALRKMGLSPLNDLSVETWRRQGDNKASTIDLVACSVSLVGRLKFWHWWPFPNDHCAFGISIPIRLPKARDVKGIRWDTIPRPLKIFWGVNKTPLDDLKADIDFFRKEYCQFLAKPDLNPRLHKTPLEREVKRIRTIIRRRKKSPNRDLLIRQLKNTKKRIAENEKKRLHLKIARLRDTNEWKAIGWILKDTLIGKWSCLNPSRHRVELETLTRIFGPKDGLTAEPMKEDPIKLPIDGRPSPDVIRKLVGKRSATDTQGRSARMLYEFLVDCPEIMQFVIHPISECWKMDMSDRAARIVLIPKEDSLEYRPLAVGDTIGRLKESILMSIIEYEINRK